MSDSISRKICQKAAESPEEKTPGLNATLAGRRDGFQPTRRFPPLMLEKCQNREVLRAASDLLIRTVCPAYEPPLMVHIESMSCAAATLPAPAVDRRIDVQIAERNLCLMNLKGKMPLPPVVITRRWRRWWFHDPELPGHSDQSIDLLDNAFRHSADRIARTTDNDP